MTQTTEPRTWTDLQTGEFDLYDQHQADLTAAYARDDRNSAANIEDSARSLVASFDVRYGQRFMDEYWATNAVRSQRLAEFAASWR